MSCTVCLSARLSAQWLESIEVMKSALQQKMLDLESEKVNFCDLNFHISMLKYLETEGDSM